MVLPRPYQYMSKTSGQPGGVGAWASAPTSPLSTQPVLLAETNGDNNNDDDNNNEGVGPALLTTPPGSPSPGWLIDDDDDEELRRRAAEKKKRLKAEVKLAQARDELRADPGLSKSLPEPTNIAGEKRKRSDDGSEGEEEGLPAPKRQSQSRPKAVDFAAHRNLKSAHKLLSQKHMALHRRFSSQRKDYQRLQGLCGDAEKAVRLQQERFARLQEENEGLQIAAQEVDTEIDRVECENARLQKMVESRDVALRALQARLPELSGIVDRALCESGESPSSSEYSYSPMPSPEIGSPVSNRSRSRSRSAGSAGSPEARRRSRSRSPSSPDRRPTPPSGSDERQRSYRTRSPPPTRRDRSPLPEERGRSSARMAAQHPASPPSRSGSPDARTSRPSSRTRAARDEAPTPDGQGRPRTPSPTQHTGWGSQQDDEGTDVGPDDFWEL